MKKLLIAIDSDGTLRYDDGTISDRVKKIIKRLVDDGNHIVICTARPRYHTKKVSKEANASRYIISSNGAEIYDNESNNIIYANYLKNEECKKIYNYATKNDIRVIFSSEDTEYSTKFIRNDNQILLSKKNCFKILNNEIKQIMIIGSEKNKILKFKNIILNDWKLNINNSSHKDGDEIWFTIVSKKVSKGNALKELAKYLNIPLNNTISIGNDINDISMFNASGKSVAVSNADNDVLKYVDEITLSNNEDGVAVFLEKIYDKGE